MKETYYATIKSNFDGFEWEDEVLCMDMNKEDIDTAEKELRKYLNKEGEVYSKSALKLPSLKEFFKLYFGDVDYDIYMGETYSTPNRFVCKDKDAANKLYSMLKPLEFHDRYSQTYCDVSLENNIVNITYGDY